MKQSVVPFAGSVATQAGKQFLGEGQKKVLKSVQDLFKKK